MEKFIQLGEKFGLEGEKLLEFVREQEEKEEKRRQLEEEKEEKRRRLEEEKRQEEEEREERRRREDEERETRRLERELRKLEREAELVRQKEAAEAAKREHELELTRLGQRNMDDRPSDREDRAKAPKLPSFVDGKDDLDAYLQRFERFVETAKWNKIGWASKLSALLSGRALEVYSRLSEEAAKDYDKVKIALMKRYDLTEDGYRRKFRASKPEADESPEQFIVRLDRYLLRWLELSDTDQTFGGLKDLIVKEQFIDSCPKDLAIHLRERAPDTLAKIAKIADQYLEAHGKHLFTPASRKPTVQPERDEAKNMQSNQTALHCFKCNTRGHKAVNCPIIVKRCFLCSKQGHEARNCRLGGRRSGGQSKDGNPVQPVKGRVGEKPVDVLRDTGCSGIVVKRDLVSEDQFTGDFNVMLLIDNTARKVPIAKIDVDTPYLKGQVEAQCLPDAVYDLIIGNVPDARAADDPDPSWRDHVQEACAVTTRSQAKKAGERIPLKIPSTNESPVVDREKLKQKQRDDKSLQKYWEKDDVVVRGQAENSFEVKGGVLYRVYKHPYVNGGKPLKQVMVPVPLRNRIMELAHGSIMGGHMGIKKTVDKIQSAFYWPGIQGDVTRYCKSCDVCQKTVNKGSVPKVPLEKMPLIDKPFKTVAIDLVGPIGPPSEDGHRYILTLVDFATPYPEAVPLKNIDTETVAEALVDIFSRLGVPEEILSDLGTQFVSECMKEVTRLLSIKQLTTTPYHPMCNGLTEKFNGTMKSMLKRLCSEQPRQWHRYINPLLFAYREVPQESTGFSPLELLYGRAVRGPMLILKELWTKEVEEPEVKNSYQYVFELREKLEDTLKLAHTELQKAQLKGKHYYDRKTKVRKFAPGDKVLVLLPTDRNKLLMQWKGPFEVSAVMGLNDYRVRVKGKERVYHANLLKKYFEREDSVGAVAFETNANICKQEHAESEIEEVDPAENIDFLEIGGYVAKESVKDVAIGDNLSHEQRAEFMDLANEFQSLFTEAPGTTSLAQHHIKLTSDQPVRSRPYPVPYSLRESLKKDITDMMKMGVIRESSSPYASPVVVVKKKDNTNRICVDYRRPNKLTIFEPEPMPTAEHLFQKLNGDKYFTRIDLSKGYWQISIPEGDIPKTAFVTPDGSYEFLKMPFGMINSAATLKRAMKKLLHGLDNVEFSWDDILVHTRTWEEHIKALRELFNRLLAAGMTIRPTKCLFGVNTVDFLGHRLEEGLIGLHEDNVTKIRDAPRPTTKKQIKSFMGLAGYYRDFIPNFAALAAPLSDLTRKGQPNKVEWGEAQEKAYQSIKVILTKEPVLRLPDPTKTYFLQTDASDSGIGAVLMQKHDGKLFPVCYASKRLSSAERNYSTIEKECLAIVWGFKRFHLYLYGVSFVLQTDHEPLKYMNSAKFANGRLMRWAMFLQSYNFRVEAIKGSENVGADYLSRVEK